MGGVENLDPRIGGGDGLIGVVAEDAIGAPSDEGAFEQAAKQALGHLRISESSSRRAAIRRVGGLYFARTPATIEKEFADADAAIH
jgi:hypothetical protein